MNEWTKEGIEAHCGSMAFRIYIVFIAFKYLRGCGYDMSKCFVWCQFDNDDKVEGR